MNLDKQLMLVGQRLDRAEDIIRLLAGRLYQAGYVTKEFEESILMREKTDPTGLKTKSYGVAIPHTSNHHVIQSNIAVVTLRNPVHFYQMGTNKEKLDVQLVFMLAIKEPEDQLTMLSNLMDLFKEEKLLGQLLASPNEDIVLQQLQYHLNKESELFNGCH